MKTKIIPFDLDTAKKIQAGEIKGRIVTNHGKVVTLVDAAYGFNEEYWIPIIWHWQTGHNQLVLYNSKGECRNSHSNCYLHIELPEEAPEHKFKPFDKVLVRNGMNCIWQPSIFSYQLGDCCYTVSSYSYEKENIIPYEGNEHLVGTTNKPEEE